MKNFKEDSILTEGNHNLNLENQINKSDTVKYLLECLVKKNTIETVITYILLNEDKKKEKLEKEKKMSAQEKELQSIISLLLKEVGQLNLIQHLINIHGNNSINTTSNKCNTTVGSRAETIIPSSSTVEEENNGDIIINIDDEDDNNNSNFKKDFEDNNKIISLSESEDKNSHSDNNKNNKDKIDKKDKKDKKIKKEKNEKKFHSRINSESKQMKDQQKLERKKNRLGTHYSKGNDYFYKYILDNCNRTYAYFSCADAKCEGTGKYTLRSKLFEINNEHSLKSEDHIYNRNKVVSDSEYLNLMIKKKIEELQVVKDKKD